MFTIKILLYGQVITSWLMIMAGVSIAICTMFFNDKQKRAWVGYTGLLLLAFGVFVMLHYFVRSGNNMYNILKQLYTIYPQSLENLR